MSHRESIPRAEQSCNSFHDNALKIGNVIVVADETASEYRYSVDDARSILFVPANAKYEGLPGKVAKAFLFLGLSPLTMPIPKAHDAPVSLALFNSHYPIYSPTLPPF